MPANSVAPHIVGKTMYCPDSGPAQLECSNIQGSNYQWFKRKFNEQEARPIEGETSAAISLDLYKATANYFYVSFEHEGNSYTTPEVKIDQWAFSLPTVVARGNYKEDNGSFVLGIGGYVIFKLNLPYNTNIIWYKDEMPLQGQNKNQLKVTEPGVYNVEGAPEQCPNFSNRLGVNLIVVKK